MWLTWTTRLDTMERLDGPAAFSFPFFTRRVGLRSLAPRQGGRSLAGEAAILK